jgi:hypothetical protein
MRHTVPGAVTPPIRSSAGDRKPTSLRVRRRRSYARRKLRKALRAWVKDSWRLVAVVVASTVAVCWVLLTVEPSRFMSGLLTGMFGMALLTTLLLLFLIPDGNMLALAGAWAEDLSNDEIRLAVKARSVWGAVANIEVGGFDIDHLVVAPGGVFAIETKSRSGGGDPRRLLADVAQAKNAAKKAESILRSQHVLMPNDVTPVLVIWGKRATRDLPRGGRIVDGVPVVSVAHLAEWLTQHRTGRIAEDHAEVMLALLREFTATQIVRERVLL